MTLGLCKGADSLGGWYTPDSGSHHCHGTVQEVEPVTGLRIMNVAWRNGAALSQLRGLKMLPSMALERPKRKGPVDGTRAASQGMSAGGNCSPRLRPTGILHQDPS